MQHNWLTFSPFQSFQRMKLEIFDFDISVAEKRRKAFWVHPFSPPLQDVVSSCPQVHIPRSHGSCLAQQALLSCSRLKGHCFLLPSFSSLPLFFLGRTAKRSTSSTLTDDREKEVVFVHSGLVPCVIVLSNVICRLWGGGKTPWAIPQW